MFRSSKAELARSPRRWGRSQVEGPRSGCWRAARWKAASALRCAPPRLPALVDIKKAWLGSAGMIAAPIGITSRGAQDTVAEISLREITALRRYRAWASGERRCLSLIRRQPRRPVNTGERCVEADAFDAAIAAGADGLRWPGLRHA